MMYVLLVPLEWASSGVPALSMQEILLYQLLLCLRLNRRSRNTTYHYSSDGVLVPVRPSSAYSSIGFKFGPRRDVCATVRDVSQNATSLVMIMSDCLVVDAYFTRLLYYYPLDW